MINHRQCQVISYSKHRWWCLFLKSICSWFADAPNSKIKTHQSELVNSINHKIWTMKNKYFVNLMVLWCQEIMYLFISRLFSISWIIYLLNANFLPLETCFMNSNSNDQVSGGNIEHKSRQHPTTTGLLCSSVPLQKTPVINRCLIYIIL